MSEIKIVQSGDINSTDPNDYVIDSTSEGTFKIDNVITMNITSTGGLQELETSQPHNLDYVPVFFATVKPDSDTYAYKTPFQVQAGLMLKVYADATNIYARAVTTVADTYRFRVTVFREKII